tara:strand:- start:8 stop:403 length:396 start_codon:yes stop_codon:yes gene_type:complete
MDSIFSKIISGEIPSYKVAEDSHCYAFLDINPNSKGHVLCIPRLPLDKLFDLPNEDYIRLFSFSRKVALAMRQVIPCKRIALSVVGLEVPHAHIHLIPINTMDDVSFQKKVNISDIEMKEISNSIAQNFKP